ncbi:MAG: YdcF family protein [Bacteriovoracaceae bacterium]|jgi:hypothetical protein|nr:YdcF family protein [Bacteriovoracaceae bacterium]
MSINLAMGTTAISSGEYAFGTSEDISDRGISINVDYENEKASIYIQENFEFLNSLNFPAFVIPGYTPLKAKTGIILHKKAKKRLAGAYKSYLKNGGGVFIVSGGNVHPDLTPYNEAMEMKRYLMEQLQVSEEMIVIEPYARHSTTNIRNVGRFLLSHGLGRALIVSSIDQSFYFSFPHISSFNSRSRRELGYLVGKLKSGGYNRSQFFPDKINFTVGSDPLDP